jgi:Lrp/AsnC family transcriptional regulator for asnA, asnC and gidA
MLIDDMSGVILKRLAANARVNMSELAKELNCSVSTIHKRMKQLEKRGAVDVLDELEERSDILEIYETLEPYDLFLKVRTTDIHTLKNELINPISEIDGVLEVRSILTTRRHKEVTTNLALEDKVDLRGINA